MKPTVSTYIKLYREKRVSIKGLEKAISKHIITKENIREGINEMIMDKTMDVVEAADILIGLKIIKKVEELYNSENTEEEVEDNSTSDKENK